MLHSAPFCLSALLVAASALSAKAELRAGVAAVDITPPPALKASLGGYGERMSRPAVANLARAVTAAGRDLTPITLATGSTILHGWNANRRAGNTVVDPELTITRIDKTDGKPLAVLVNWTAHPTFTGPDDMLFSGD